MAKGKHAQAASRRRAIADADAIDDLVREVLAELSRTEEAERQAAEVVAATEHLSALQRRRDAAVADEVGRLAAVRKELEGAVADEERLAAEIRRAWSDVVPVLLTTYGGSALEAMEHLVGDLGSGAQPLIRRGTASKRLTARGVEALQRARGLRSGPRPVHNLESRAVEEWLVECMTSVGRGRGLRHEWRAMGAWATMPMVSAPAAPELAPFGALTAIDVGESPSSHELHSCADPACAICSGSGTVAVGRMAVDEEARSWLASGPSPEPTEALRESAAWAFGARAVPEERWANPFVPFPTFPVPADALALRWWYMQACAEEEVLAALGADFDAGAQGSFDKEPIGTTASVWRQAATMLATAALYWLPPGQSISYLSSLPLSAEDRNELRMPASRTMVIPGDEVLLEPVGSTSDDDEYRTLLEASFYADAAAIEQAKALDDLQSGRTASCSEALRAFGAKVEAVVLEADRSGRRSRRMLWCLAIPSHSGRSVIARIVVPAWRDRTCWGEAADQLAAVAAWGDWAPLPDMGSEQHGRGPRQPKSGGPTGDPFSLVVLDAGRTEKTSGGSSNEGGRSVAPHLRRGHWRRQHYGPQGQMVKRLRIAPTVVNAGRGPLAPRVYRLPHPPPAI